MSKQAIYDAIASFLEVAKCQKCGLKNDPKNNRLVEWTDFETETLCVKCHSELVCDVMTRCELVFVYDNWFLINQNRWPDDCKTVYEMFAKHPEQLEKENPELMLSLRRSKEETSSQQK